MLENFHRLFLNIVTNDEASPNRITRPQLREQMKAYSSLVK